MEELLTNSAANNQHTWLLSYLDVFVLIIMLVITLLAISEINTANENLKTSQKPAIVEAKLGPVQIKPAVRKKVLPKPNLSNIAKKTVKNQRTPDKNPAITPAEKAPATTSKTISAMNTDGHATTPESDSNLSILAHKLPAIMSSDTLTPTTSSQATKAAPKLEKSKTDQKIILANNRTKNQTPAEDSVPFNFWQQQLNKKLAKLQLDDSVQIKVNQGYAQIQIQNNILFQSAKAKLTEAGKDLLERLSPLLKQASGLIFIEGHTDNRPIKTKKFPSNWELGSARATSVLHFLASRQLKAERLRAVTYADTMPIADNNTETGRRKNRRVNILIKIPENFNN